MTSGVACAVSRRARRLGMITETMTVLEVLQSTTAYFKKREIESPRLNAEHLLAHSFGKKRIELYLEFERPLSEAELAPLRELVQAARPGRTAATSARHGGICRAHFR